MSFATQRRTRALQAPLASGTRLLADVPPCCPPLDPGPQVRHRPERSRGHRLGAVDGFEFEDLGLQVGHDGATRKRSRSWVTGRA